MHFTYFRGAKDICRSTHLHRVNNTPNSRVLSVYSTKRRCNLHPRKVYVTSYLEKSSSLSSSLRELVVVVAVTVVVARRSYKTVLTSWYSVLTILTVIIRSWFLQVKRRKRWDRAEKVKRKRNF
jgi:hypothetical protein